MSDHPLESWRWLFIILGLPTVLWGVLLFLILPDTPSKAWFLSREERLFAQQRHQSVQRSWKTNEWKISQFCEAIKDLKTWFFFVIITTGSLTNGVISNFSALIIQSLGFDTFTTLLLNLPIATFQFIVVIVSSLAAQRFRKSRLILVIIGNIVALVGTLLIRQQDTNNKGGRFAGVMLLLASSNIFPLMLSLISSNVGGITKKATVNAIFFLGYCAGNIAGPQMFISKEAPTHQTAFTGLLSLFCLVTAFLALFRLYLDLENKRRDKEQGKHIDAEQKDGCPVSEPNNEGPNLHDETDFENSDYRYCL
ncbi:major facilitator superfamily domain-containing protein [Penicillium cinerascens]|uniref:Major facilitator superfamily domain-containing protein n=1 Tax=Penicillium cinerascens TaxID=70096 RepID=A0A9W9J645_9EURO|nr:major facilitator superfamily domain-containing protein [Penicillium cinerascens]KAJ5191249.1 major facilitator superfamily domain-containing protein [Penicillium cinerascens]